MDYFLFELYKLELYEGSLVDMNMTCLLVIRG